MSEAKKRKVPSAELKAKVGLEAVRGYKTTNESWSGIRGPSSTGRAVEEGGAGAGQGAVRGQAGTEAGG